MSKEIEIQDIAKKLQKFLDSISDTLIKDISKEIREANKQYRDIIYIAGELNARLSR